MSSHKDNKLSAGYVLRLYKLMQLANLCFSEEENLRQSLARMEKGEMLEGRYAWIMGRYIGMKIRGRFRVDWLKDEVKQGETVNLGNEFICEFLVLPFHFKHFWCIN